MQPFKRFRFVHNNKELNYPAIPEPDDFFIKRGVGTVDIPDIEAFDCPTSDINNSPRPSILEDIPMPRRIYITRKVRERSVAYYPLV